MIENLLTKTLLYAEDELSIQTQYGTYFKNIFKDVYLASDGEEAFSFFKQKNPDAIILDINMPKISGLELTKKIKEVSPNTPIILLTARSDKETLKYAIELQLLTYLEKPVSRNALKNALEKLSNRFKNENIVTLWQNQTNHHYTWNRIEKLLYCDSENLRLTKKETLLFDLLIEKNSLCTYQDIYEYVWENSDKEFSESTIKTLLSGLKLKLPKDAIKNQYGVGYFINLIS